MNKDEYGLFIIWENARFAEEKIIEDIKTRFTIMNIFEIEWDKNIFSKNLTRFYGENLPKNSAKEKHCGNGKFMLLILKDCNPLYGYRSTSKGRKYLNVNFFDSKTMYRSWTGSHRIHATNDMNEFYHDLMMLLGVNLDDYLSKYKHNDNIIKLKQNIIGEDGWDSLEQIFYVLNETINYVVLRNFKMLPEVYEVGIHSDVDLLCDSRDNMIKILNAKPDKKSKKRSRYIVNVKDDFVYMDLRYIGDNYYDKKWEKEMLNTRQKYKCFFIPNNENYSYSLLYHALVQKGKVADDYKDIFLEIFSSKDLKILSNKLNTFMNQKGYNYVDAVDYSVYFNYKFTKKYMRITKIIYFYYIRIFYKIKGVIKK